jgi:hypothetical protein
MGETFKKEFARFHPGIFDFVGFKVMAQAFVTCTPFLLDSWSNDSINPPGPSHT